MIVWSRIVAICIACLASTPLFFGCSGGGGNSTSDPNANISQITGVAQLGYILNGNVSVYKLSDLESVVATATTSGSLSIDSAGRFAMDIVDLADSDYYLLTVTGGKDAYANNNGELDITTQVDLDGTLHALATGDELKSGVRINVFTDMIYQKLKESITTLATDQLSNSLNNAVTEYLFDIDNNGVVDYRDALAFNPVADTDKTKISYKDVVNIYFPNLHNGEDQKSILSSLFYLDPPRVIVEGGNLQEVPFILQASLENEPAGLDVKWFVDNSEKNEINETITTDGIFRISAKYYKGAEVLKTVTAEIVATSKIEVAAVDVDHTIDTPIFVTDESNSALAGTQVFIPQGALSENTRISIKKATVNAIPTGKTTTDLSDVLILQPSGLIFAKPIQVRLPYDGSLDLSNKQVRIARYSSHSRFGIQISRQTGYL